MKVYLGADHRGFELKEKIKTLLTNWKYDFEDLGAHTFDPNDDYPKVGEKVASLVASERMAMGILICGSGVGVDVVANKFDGVRASIGKDAYQVRAGRNDDDMNVLVLAADFTKESDAREMTKIFLDTKFAALPRFKRRLDEVRRIEENN